MDNTPTYTPNGIVPENFPEKLTELPKIISDKIQLLNDLQKKVEEAQKAAEKAEKQSKELKGYKEKKFLWIKWKSGDTKGNIEGTQNAVSALAEAQKVSAEAQDLAFKFQQELAKASEYLFCLGCYNIASNEAMIANLNENLKGDSENGGVLSAKVKEQFRNVVTRLIEQRDVLYRQQKIEEKSKKQDCELKKLNEEAKGRDEKISEQSAQISSLTESLKEKNKLDEEQTKKIEELIRILQEKDRLDIEQSNKILELEGKLITINNQLGSLSKKITNRTIVFSIVCLLAIIIVGVKVMGIL